MPNASSAAPNQYKSSCVARNIPAPIKINPARAGGKLGKLKVVPIVDIAYSITYHAILGIGTSFGSKVIQNVGSMPNSYID